MLGVGVSLFFPVEDRNEPLLGPCVCCGGVKVSSTDRLVSRWSLEVPVYKVEVLVWQVARRVPQVHRTLGAGFLRPPAAEVALGAGFLRPPAAVAPPV